MTYSACRRLVFGILFYLSIFIRCLAITVNSTTTEVELDSYATVVGAERKSTKDIPIIGYHKVSP